MDESILPYNLVLTKSSWKNSSAKKNYVYAFANRMGPLSLENISFTYCMLIVIRMSKN